MQLPYKINKIDIIVDNVRDVPRNFDAEECIHWLVLLTNCFVREFCGLKAVRPHNARVAFSAGIISRLSDSSVPYRAKVEHNNVSAVDMRRQQYNYCSCYCACYTVWRIPDSRTTGTREKTP